MQEQMDELQQSIDDLQQTVDRVLEGHRVVIEGCRADKGRFKNEMLITREKVQSETGLPIRISIQSGMPKHQVIACLLRMVLLAQTRWNEIEGVEDGAAVGLMNE